MQLLRLSLQNFKNHTTLELELRRGFNFILGPNGSGKTNILDAIHYLSFTRSYFNLQDSQNIKHEEPFMVLETQASDEEQYRLAMKRGGRKVLTRNGAAYERMTEHLGRIPAIMMTPFDTELIFEGSASRRKYLDILLCQADREYAASLSRYNRALEQRNAQLKQFSRQGRYDPTYLEAWDQVLNKEAPRIFEGRRQLLQELAALVATYYNRLSGGRESAALIYSSALEHSSMEDLLRNNEQKDRLLERTSAGVHRDDLELQLDQYPVSRTGSQGQQKSFILALKLAAAHYLRVVLDTSPLLMLDDVFDRLDPHRTLQLLKLLEQEDFGQVFFTHTDPAGMEKIFGASYQQQVVISFPPLNL